MYSQYVKLASPLPSHSIGPPRQTSSFVIYICARVTFPHTYHGSSHATPPMALVVLVNSNFFDRSIEVSEFFQKYLVTKMRVDFVAAFFQKVIFFLCGRFSPNFIMHFIS